MYAKDKDIKILNFQKKPIKKISFSVIFLFTGACIVQADFTGRYCDLEGARTSSGESVSAFSGV